MAIEPRKISKAMIEAALEEAGGFLMSGQVRAAEQACMDVLAVETDCADALSLLIEAKSLGFERDAASSVHPVVKLVGRVRGDFDRFYLMGLVYERWAAAQLSRGVPAFGVSQWLTEAMAAFEKAEKIAAGSDVRPTLRWNACLRLRQTRSL